MYGDNQIMVGVRVTEEYTRYVNGQIEPPGLRTDTQTYRLLLRLEEGRWKIAKTIR